MENIKKGGSCISELVVVAWVQTLQQVHQTSQSQGQEQAAKELQEDNSFSSSLPLLCATFCATKLHSQYLVPLKVIQMPVFVYNIIYILKC